jgi:hypothetical protein
MRPRGRQRRVPEESRKKRHFPQAPAPDSGCSGKGPALRGDARQGSHRAALHADTDEILASPDACTVTLPSDELLGLVGATRKRLAR